jgi:hypothetical protein
LGHYLPEQFGCRVRKISVDAGFGCPNVDGTVGTGGCLFCNIASFSPSRRKAVGAIRRQIDEGAGRLRRRYRADRFLAYFQPATNTHAPLARLREVFQEAASHPEVVGLVIGTRPDAVGEDVLDLLAELSEKTWLSVELGLQTIHDRSLDWLSRGHHYGAFLDAVQRARRRHLRIGVHIILGLPGESQSDIIATARELARLRIDSVKLHNLHVARDTPLASIFASGQLHLPDRDQYASMVVDFLEELHLGCVIDRLSADAPPEYLVAPVWCADKPAVLGAIRGELERRDTWQGRLSSSIKFPVPARMY